jgi:regulator of cell morphogenesis and NO signaling
MQIQKENTIGEIVAQNFRAAQVFESFGLDFCCGGKKTISDACSIKGLNPESVIKEIYSIPENGFKKVPDYNTWGTDFLIDYIINTHHVYVMNALPNIFAHSQKVAAVHGEHHPEVVTIAEHFEKIKDELETHMQKEEKMLFPYIKNLNNIKQNKTDLPFPPFGTVDNPIKVMEMEHESAGTTMSKINELSKGYQPPEDACTTFKVLYQELREFEDDLHVHIHLENNILFPKAIAIEKALMKN